MLPQTPKAFDASQETDMAGQRRIPTEFLQQYLALISDGANLDPEARLRESLSHHAELNFKLNGGRHCPVCNAHVRHVIQVVVEKGAETKSYECLCTRCLEAERASADRVTLKLGRGQVTLKKKEKHATRRWDETAEKTIDSSRPAGKSNKAAQGKR